MKDLHGKTLEIEKLKYQPFVVWWGMSISDRLVSFVVFGREQLEYRFNFSSLEELHSGVVGGMTLAGSGGVGSAVSQAVLHLNQA